MAKKLDVREYQCELIKVLDGDTIDCYIDLGFDLKIKKRIRYMGIDTWESRTRDLEEKAKGLLAKARNKELLEAGVFKLKSLELESSVEFLVKFLYHLIMLVNI